MATRIKPALFKARETEFVDLVKGTGGRPCSQLTPMRLVDARVVRARILRLRIRVEASSYWGLTGLGTEVVRANLFLRTDVATHG